MTMHVRFSHHGGLPVMLAAGLALASCRSPERTRPEGAAPSVDVVVARAVSVDLPAYYEAGGVVRARVSAVISSRLLAPITAVHVRAGDRVRRGDPLIDLDAREPQAQDERAGAALAAAEQAVRGATDDERAANAALALARAQCARVSALFDKRSATAQERDEAEAALSTAEARASAASARVEQARAVVRSARAEADAVAIAVSYTTLTAPFDGVVTERAADPGTTATPGAPLLLVEKTDAYRLDVALDERRAGGLSVGAPVEIRFAGAEDDSASSWHPTRIVELSHVDPTAHTVRVGLEVPPNTSPRSGRFGYARFPGPTERVLAIPTLAVVARGQLAFAFVIDRGVARLRAVSVGRQQACRTEVLAGLVAGDDVIVEPPPGLGEGRPVRATAYRDATSRERACR